MASGGKAAARAGERVAEGLIAKAVKDILRTTTKDAAKDAGKDAAKAAGKDAAKNAAKDAGRDAGKDAAKDAGGDAGRKSARETADGAENAAKDAKDRKCVGDPIDVASGEMVLTHTDVDLDGVLPLVLARTHVSSYRTGRWFGATWASTLDQRLEVDEAGACFVGPDGLVVAYAIPMLGEAVLPERGPRRPLTLSADGYTVTDPLQGRTLLFAAQPGTADLARGRAMVLPLKAIIDRNDNRIDLGYDADGALTEVRHSGGYRIGVETWGGRITALRLLTSGNDSAADPVLVRFGYDDLGRLTEVTGSSGRPTRFAYDPAGRITRWADTNGCWYSYVYEDGGRVVRTEGSGGFLSSTLTYHERVTVVTDSLGHETAYHLNELGQVVAETDPLGATTWSEWDPYDRLLSRTDALHRVTRYAYDEQGNLVAITRPDGAQITATYNDLCLPLEVIDADGGVWRQAYDERGDLVALADPAGATTAYGYTERGHLAWARDPLGAITRVETDAAGLSLAVTDPLGNTIRYTRDPFGRVSAGTDPLGGVTRFGWTIEGKPAWRMLPDGATELWSYDGEGNLSEYVDAAGSTTRVETTHFDLPAAETGPDGARLEFAYDTELRLATVTNPQGLVWRYDYDAAGNLIRETDFNGRILSYGHDAAGQLVERTNGLGQVTRYARDALGDIVEQRAGEAVTTFTYDPAGRLVRAVSADADLSLHRDPLGRVIAETCNGRSVTSAFDPAGRLVRRRTPSGAESSWEYDPAGRPIALHSGGQTMRFGYDPAGREITRHIGAQVALTQQWDAAHRLTGQALWANASAPGTPQVVPAPDARQARLLQHRAYRYRPDGYLLGIHDQIDGARRYDLDAAGRVTEVQGSGWTERYAYDAAGNLTNATWPVAAHSDAAADALGAREYTGTLIRRAGNVRYEHDAQGRVVLRQHKTPSAPPRTWRYTWDAHDRLVGATTPDGVRWRYRYDPLGRRLSKERLAPDGSPIERVDFVWDNDVLAEQAHSAPTPDGGFALKATAWDYVPDSFRPLTQTERVPLRNAPQQWIDEQFYAIVTDLIGTPTELVDPAGSIGWRSRTSLWGSQFADLRGSGRCPLRFPGQYFDPETGLNYNYFRYYDPSIARYRTSDPIGLEGGFNPYRYVPNPTNWLDPFGLKCEDESPVGTIVNERGVRVIIHSNDHPPPHAHVQGGGPETRIGQNGKPLEGDPELTRRQREVVAGNIGKIRQRIRDYMRWHREGKLS